MNHPEVLLLPVLMLADYFGTLVGAVAIRNGYSDHFGMEHYEMNPVWQESIGKIQWFNARHLGMTAAISIGTAVLVEIDGFLPEHLAEGYIGALLGTFAYMVGRHVSNYFSFRYVAMHRDELEGTVHMAHTTLLAFSAAQVAVVAIPLAVIAAVTVNPYVIGAAIGVSGLLISHSGWIKKARAQDPAATDADSTPADDTN